MYINTSHIDATNMYQFTHDDESFVGADIWSHPDEKFDYNITTPYYCLGSYSSKEDDRQLFFGTFLQLGQKFNIPLSDAHSKRVDADFNASKEHDSNFTFLWNQSKQEYVSSYDNSINDKTTLSEMSKHKIMVSLCRRII